jgi:hypothetical protein
VASVTKFLLACVALHTGQHQAFLVLLALDLKRTPITSPYYLVTPGIEEFHVFGTYFSSGQNTDFGVFG